LTDHPHNGGFDIASDDARVVVAQAALEKAAATAKRLQDLQATRSKVWYAVSRALQATEAWLRDGRPGGTRIEDYEVAEVSLQKGERLLTGIERIQDARSRPEIANQMHQKHRTTSYASEGAHHCADNRTRAIVGAHKSIARARLRLRCG